MKLVIGTDKKTSIALIDKAIVSIQTRGKKLDQDIHIAGCSCLNHIELHGDFSLLNRLVAAMPKGSRVNALREWAEAYGKVSFDKETKEFRYAKDKVTLLDDAMQTSWTEFKQEPAYQGMDLDAELSKVLKRAFSRVSKQDEAKGDKIDAKKLRAIAKAAGYKEEVK